MVLRGGASKWLVHGKLHTTAVIQKQMFEFQGAADTGYQAAP